MNSLHCTATVLTVDAVRGPLVAFGQSHPEITRLVLFGSLARGDMHAESDVDVVVDFAPGSTPEGNGRIRLHGRPRTRARRSSGPSRPPDRAGSFGECGRVWQSFVTSRAVRRDGILIYERESAAARGVGTTSKAMCLPPGA